MGCMKYLRQRQAAKGVSWALGGLEIPLKNKELSLGKVSCTKKAFAIFNLVPHVLRVGESWEKTDPQLVSIILDLAPPEKGQQLTTPVSSFIPCGQCLLQNFYCVGHWIGLLMLLLRLILQHSTYIFPFTGIFYRW